MVGRVLLLKIAPGPSSVLLVLVRIELEFVAMDTVLFHTALGKMPKVAAEGSFIPKGTSSKDAFFRAASGEGQVGCPSRRL